MKWINVKNKLPEVKKDVLLLTDAGVIQGYLSRDGSWCPIWLDQHGCGCCGTDDTFTHWMEMPTLP